jgi:hypothetical protein
MLNWRLSPPSLRRCRSEKSDRVLVLAATIPAFKKVFGTKGEVDPIRHLTGTAAGGGGNPDKDATYLNITPSKNDGKTIYRLNVKDVPVNGFWSVSVYNPEGYYQKNEYNAYALNNITAKKNDDGSIAIQFGGCDWLRRQDRQLIAYLSALELHGAALSPACRDSQRRSW